MDILEKGLTSRKKAENGIKGLKPGIYEAKDCRNDVRLVAYKTYINKEDNENNENNKKLILFTKEMNHIEVSRYIRNNTCEEIYCTNHNDELPLIGALSMDE